MFFIFIFRELQFIGFTFYDSYLLLIQDTNQFLFSCVYTFECNQVLGSLKALQKESTLTTHKKIFRVNFDSVS